MKNLIYRRPVWALLVVCASALFFACQKDPVEPTNPTPEVLAYKDLTLTDVSGQNSVVLRVTSTEAALLEAQDWSKIVTVEPLTETPDVQDFKEPAEQTDAPTGNPEIDFEVVSQQMQPGVKALALHFRPQTNGGTDDRWQWVTTYTTSYNHIRVRVNYGCHNVYYYRRPTSSSNYIFMGAYYYCCYPGFWTVAWSVPSYRMRAKVYYNTGTSFTVTVW